MVQVQTEKVLNSEKEAVEMVLIWHFFFYHAPTRVATLLAHVIFQVATAKKDASKMLTAASAGVSSSIEEGTAKNNPRMGYNEQQGVAYPNNLPTSKK